MLYKLTRTEHHGYDEYDEIVVRAASADQARRLVCRTDELGLPVFDGFRPDGSNVRVEKIEVAGTPKVICTSFNAG